MTDTAKRRRKVDWEAVERDYRTGRFTLRELEAKHGPAYATIGQRAKREGWTQDLRKVIKQATHAKLAESLVAQATQAHTQATQALTQSTVEVAAEAGKQVVLKHRGWLQALAEDAARLRAKLLEMSESVADVREAAVAVGAVEALTRTTKTLIEKERQAFQLDDDARDTTSDATPVDWASMPPADCQVAVIGLLKGR